MCISNRSCELSLTGLNKDLIAKIVKYYLICLLPLPVLSYVSFTFQISIYTLKCGNRISNVQCAEISFKFIEYVFNGKLCIVFKSSLVVATAAAAVRRQKRKKK